MKIRGNIVGVTALQTDLNQTDSGKGDFLRGREAILAHHESRANPHGVTAAQVGARPDTWMPTAEQVGAVTEVQVTELINNALGVIENGTY